MTFKPQVDTSYRALVPNLNSSYPYIIALLVHDFCKNNVLIFLHKNSFTRVKIFIFKPNIFTFKIKALINNCQSICTRVSI